jgi:hypothetical protein
VPVIEVNDSPNLTHGIEDGAEGDAPWLKILSWFSHRFMANRAGLASKLRAAQPSTGSHAAVPLVENRRAS